MKVRPTARSLRQPLLTTLTLVGFASLAVPVYAEGPTPPKAGRVVAITFDDLPYASDGSTVSPDAAIAAQRHIVGALRRARVPATGFVNEDKVQALGPVGPRLLADWNKGLLALGNHGYSHFNSNDLDVAGIEKEVVKGEATIRPLAASSDRSIPFFRFPYNHVGDTEAKRLTIEKLLASHGYKLAASTIDTSDYLFNSAYERAFAKRNKAMMQRVEHAYLDHTRVQIIYYGELDRKVLGREVPAIMLLHANRLNAATIEPLLGLFRSAGYGFVSLAQAQADPAYSVMPAVATKFGPMWAYRWARERQVKVDGRLEQEPPAWISAYAGKTP
jgi:peptidoglycan/xylan/chitin deacetylase (PgdA/CDA1 family)